MYIIECKQFDREDEGLLTKLCMPKLVHSCILIIFNGIRNIRPVCPKTRPLANVPFSSAKGQTTDDDM